MRKSRERPAWLPDHGEEIWEVTIEPYWKDQFVFVNRHGFIENEQNFYKCRHGFIHRSREAAYACRDRIVAALGGSK